MNKKLVLGVILSILAVIVAIRILLWTAIAAFYIVGFLILFGLGIAVGWLLHSYKSYRAEKERKDPQPR